VTGRGWSACGSSTTDCVYHSVVGSVLAASFTFSHPQRLLDRETDSVNSFNATVSCHKQNDVDNNPTQCRTDTAIKHTRSPAIAEIADRTLRLFMHLSCTMYGIATDRCLLMVTITFEMWKFGVRSLRVQGRCTGLKVVKSCSYDGTSYSLCQTLLL